MTNLLFVGLATTGLDYIKHDIIKISYCIYKPDEADELDPLVNKEFHIRPRQGTKPSQLDKEALKYNGITIEELRTFDKPSEVAYEIIKDLKEYSDMGENKICLISQNLNFDYNFLVNFFKVHTDYSFGSYVKKNSIDLLKCLPLVEHLTNKTFKDYKFKTLTEYFKIDYEQGSVDSKRYATSQLWEEIMSNIRNRGNNEL